MDPLRVLQICIGREQTVAVEGTQASQHTITNLLEGLQIQHIYGMMVSPPPTVPSPTHEAPVATVQTQNSLEPAPLTVDSQSISSEPVIVDQASENLHVFSVLSGSEPTPMQNQQESLDQPESSARQNNHEPIITNNQLELRDQPTPSAGQTGQDPNNSETEISTTFPIDNFLESISKPLPQPLLEGGFNTPLAHIGSTSNKSWHISSPPGSGKRKSIRLAKKAAANPGKDSMQFAHDLLIKKLGDLSGDDNSQNAPDNDFYMQHFAKPVDKSTMEAITMLIEQGTKKQKKGASQKRAAVAPALEA